MTDYTRYGLTFRQRTGATILGCAVCFAAAWLVVRHPAISAAASPAGLLYPSIYRKSLCRRRKERLRLHFKEMLQALASLLSAGRSVENAFLSLEADLALMLGDLRSDLLRELRTMANRLRTGEPLEPMLREFALRSGLEEIRSFADAFAVGKRAGGDLLEIVRRTSLLIGEKMEVEGEVAVLMSQKRFEARIMIFMPFAFIGFLGFFAPEYMAPLHQGIGWLLLAACLAMLGFCCRWILKIMSIEV